MSDESETCGGLSGETASGKNKTTPSNASSVNEGSNSEYRKSLLQAVPEEAMTPQTNFQIPESNASDIAPSECSSYYRKGKKKFSSREQIILRLGKLKFYAVPHWG